jgi:RND superfamily putative drug exporter
MIIIIAGLTLDYDLFLITRVVEHLTSGYDVPSAMALALSDTGPSITAAGLVMVISFGALLLPDVPVINEFGAVLVIASCVDAFLVRCVIVPAFANWGGMRGFYPRKFEVSKTIVRG